MSHLYTILALLILLVGGVVGCNGGDNPAAPAGDAAGAGDPQAGQRLFEATCSTCHGPEGEGVPGLGKDMTTSEFIASQSEQQLVEVIKAGIPPGQAPNDTAVAMPPKGGNPSLSDEDLHHIAAYIKTLSK